MGGACDMMCECEACGQDERVLIEEDVVNNPSHYKFFPDMEAIDIIKKVLTPTEFIGYTKGNKLKYKLRAGEKGPAQQDLDKAEVYDGWLRDEY